MIRQSLDRASPYGMPTFKEEVLSSVHYHLKNSGIEKTRQYLKSENEFHGHKDCWPAIKREADRMIREYAKAHQKDYTPSDTFINTIIKKNHNGHPIDFESLHSMIDLCFVSQIRHSYDWLALWRVLYDQHLLEDTNQSAFARQMNEWYPDARKCKTDSLNDYSSPYLGTKPFTCWNEEEFLRHKTSKQCVSGYRRLLYFCIDLHEKLRQVPVITP